MLMMFPFEAPTIFEGVHKSHFRMPRVVRDQKGKYENDDLFRQLSNESLVKYTAFKERPLEERQVKFITGCQEGHTEISFTQSGNQFILTFNPTFNPAINGEGCDFNKEMDKVHIKSPFILNGVCVVWRGYIDLRRLDGSGCLEFDEWRANLEEQASKVSIQQDNSIKLKQEQPFNMLCNNSALNQSNVAAAAALAAASAAVTGNPFHPAISSPLSRYPSAGARITPLALPPTQQHTPPTSLHQSARISPTLNNNLNSHLNPSTGLPQTAITTPTTPISNGCPSINNLNNSTSRSPQHQNKNNNNNNNNNHNNNIHNNHHQLTQQQQQQVPISQPPPPQMTQAHLAAAMGAMGANGQGPQMSLADSYGNAAIAAAAAAAFHQALSASQQQHQHHQDYQQHLQQQHHLQQQQQQQNHHQQAVAAAMGMGAPVDFLTEMSVHRQRAS